MKLSSIFLAICLVMAANANSFKENSVSKKEGELHFQANIGQFRLVNGSGEVTIDFEGSIVIHGLKGVLKINGDFQQKYRKHFREVYHGKGRITFVGTFRSVQCIGKCIHGDWIGSGSAYLTAEYDEKLQTGTYWFEDSKIKKPWSRNGHAEIKLPHK